MKGLNLILPMFLDISEKNWMIVGLNSNNLHSDLSNGK